jgi:hypothetical protein
MTIRPIRFLEDMTGFDVKWAEGLPFRPEQQDAEFYKYSSSSFVCEVKKDGFMVDIYCDGDMRYRRASDDVHISDGQELIDAGYDDSEKFSKAMNDEVLIHIMNPWFDLYTYGEHLDCVIHTIDEALSSAKAYLIEEITNAKEIENIGVSGLEVSA